MRELKRLAWAAAVAAASAAPGFAQMGGGGTGGGLGTAATTGLSSTPLSGGSTGTGGTGSGSTGGTGTTGGTANATLPQAPTLTRPSQANVTNPAIATSNFLRGFYGAPYYQGSNMSFVPNGLPGGFGAALYPATATGGAGRGGVGGIGGAGGRAGAAGGGVNTTDPGGILVPLPRQIAYAAQVRFAIPPAPPTQLLTDLRGEIDRAPAIANPAGVQIQVDGRAVILRGAVRDQDEARLVEGMVRLTPGVGSILNELTYPGK